MPAYRYRAVHASGRITQGHIGAANEWELAQHLSHSGLELIDAKIKRDLQPRFRMQPRVSLRALAVFTSQIADLLKAGVPFIEALHDITVTAERGTLRDALTDITRSINHGSRIGLAFGHYPRLFSPVFAAILAAGETSGDLTGTFVYLTRYMENRARMAEKIRRALRYPLFLLAISFGVVTFMMTLVVPQILQFLATIDSQLPLMTRILIVASEIFAAGWWIILLGVIASTFAVLFLYRHSHNAALKIDALLLRLPVIGTVIEKLALARFVQSFSTLFQSGVGILTSLRSAKGSLGNRALMQKLEEAEMQIQSGSSLSQAMRGILPAFALRMIRTGEYSGQLGKNLDDIAVAYDREVNDVTEKLIGMLEPMLTLLVGAIMAWIVLAVLGPIYGGLSKMNVLN